MPLLSGDARRASGGRRDGDCSAHRRLRAGWIRDMLTEMAATRSRLNGCYSKGSPEPNIGW